MISKLRSKQTLIIATGAIILLASTGCQRNLAIESEMNKRSLIATMYEKYAAEFPQVEGVKVEELQQWQRQGKKIILVDVRSLAERKVSIIPGAIAVAEFELNIEQYRHSRAIIVTYCTIGYRSGKYAQKLRERGINILNLEGSLLAWSHVRGKLVNNTGLTNKIHVFSRQWQLTADSYEPVW